jgi:hypothetical protein
MVYIGTTIKGLEKAAIHETKGKLHKPARVEFQTYNPKKEYLTLNTIYKEITSFTFKDLNDLLNKVKSSKIKVKSTYKCKCIKQDEQDFDSPTLEQQAGILIGKQNPESNYSKNNPETIILLDIIKNTCTVGYLLQKELSKRKYRLKLHSQTTPPLIASCLIKYLNIKDSLLCLESKDGIIPIEASLQKIKNITAQDSIQNNIRNAKINTRLAKAEIKFISKNIQDLSLEKQNHIITQLIFSKEKQQNYRKIHEIFTLAEKLIKKDLSIITNHPNTIKNLAPKKLKLKEEIIIKHNKAELTVLIYV